MRKHKHQWVKCGIEKYCKGCYIQLYKCELCGARKEKMIEP